MKPDFALSLSFEGISLLNRQKTGWSHVGYVDLAAENLSDHLEKLNAKAKRIADGTVYSKIVIPNEQIRYIVVVYTEQQDASYLQVEAALTGATPYAVSDLVYDWEVHAGQLYIAAVARETLEEAEQFACQHKFNPVRFVATPAQNTLQREIDFGPCEGANSLLPAGEKFEPDQTIIEVAGHVIDPAPPQPSSAQAKASKPGRTKTKTKTTDKPKPRGRTNTRSGLGPAPSTGLSNVTAANTAANTHADIKIDPETKNNGGTSGPTKNNLTTAQLAAAASPPILRATPLADDLELSPALLVTNFAADETAPSRLPSLILTMGAILMLSGIAAWMFALGGDDFLNTANTSDQAASDSVPLTAADVPAQNDSLNTTAPLVATQPDETQAFASEDTEDDLIELEDDLPFAQGPTPITEQQAKVRYAATGIWLKAPTPPEPGFAPNSDDLYAASIDREILSYDAIALPSPQGGRIDISPEQQPDPPRFGQTFQLNAQGLVIATANGSLSQEGHLVFLGQPIKVAPKRVQSALEITEVTSPLAKLRPRLRPVGMGEARERLKLNGRTRAEMAMLRPRLRPASVKPAVDSPEVSSAIAAVTNSLAPKLRPKALEQSGSQVANKQNPKPKPASLASNASVAQKATLVKALNLRKVNLIGVYGTSSSRRALIRLSNGRYKKVEVGNRIDGGKVTAIGKEQLRYTKSGRNIVLKMPKS
jgi:hypothetical protein